MTDSQQRPPLSSSQSSRVPPAPPPMNMGAGKAPARPAQQTPSNTLQQSGAAASGQTPRPAAPPATAAPNAAPVNASAQKARMPARSVGLSAGHPTLEKLVRHAYDKGFSDVHVGVGETPRFRNRGDIEITDYPVTDQATFMSWLREVLTDEEIRRFQDHLEFDGATQYDFARVRINVFDTLRGAGMVLRLIPLTILTLEQLRMPLVLKDVCHYHKGLILVTGPTGSGKSTTLAAMVDYINNEMPKHV
ncbi:MAG TPA: type IV pili twitching motility protein PilT, partial [Cyanobacteria bacterium UBA8553]|nr:type IV pili twitching motility protein PilT [Cyanobacteria bacterium UBA8553]